MNICIFVQCFPPLLTVGGGVSKRYFKLCTELMHETTVTIDIITQVDIFEDIDPSVMAYIDESRIRVHFVPGISFLSPDGVVSGINVFHPQTIGVLVSVFRRADVCIVDDMVLRGYVSLVAGAYNVPMIATTHTDLPKLNAYKNNPLLWAYWHIHRRFINPTVHATCTRTFAKQIGCDHVWPPLLWNTIFTQDADPIEVQCARNTIFEQNRLKNIENSVVPVAHTYDGILLYVGRWAHEKRIEKIINNVPDNLLCVIVGDGGVQEYVDMICNVSNKTHNVLALRGMVDAHALRTYYTAVDLYVSASNFETCGNTLPESWCCGTPVAVEPAQGHLEWLRDGVNGFAIDFDAGDVNQQLSDAFRNIPSLTGLESTQKYFRDIPFMKEFNQNLIYPALEINVSWLKQWWYTMVALGLYGIMGPPLFVLATILHFGTSGVTIGSRFSQNKCKDKFLIQW